MHYFFRMVLNDVSNRRKNKGTVGSGRIEIHKKILIFGNVIQKIAVIFRITLFFYYLCPKIDKVYEVSHIEECDGTFTAFEMKWNPKKASLSVPSPFKNEYPLRQFVVVTPENYLEWTV